MFPIGSPVTYDDDANLCTISREDDCELVQGMPLSYPKVVLHLAFLFVDGTLICTRVDKVPTLDPGIYARVA